MQSNNFLISNLRYFRSPLGSSLLLATGLVAGLFFLQGHIDINLADEGFLWYGTQRTLVGEVPLRDFQSYDPGRYYWGLLWFKLLGNDSLMTLRISNAIFQTLGLTCGLLVVRRLTRSPWLLLSAGIILLLWMHPRHKLFEPSISMAAVYMALLLIEHPSFLRHFLSGVFVGFAAFLGRNHGLYTFLSFLLLIGFIWLKLDQKNLIKRVSTWVAGIWVGYTPMLLMILLIPGYFKSFNTINETVIRMRRTNLPLPVPWFWRFDYFQLDWLQSVHTFSVGLLFLALPLFNGIALIFLCSRKPSYIQKNPVLVAATFLSLTYTHYAFSRADLPHLTQAIHPFLLGFMATIKAIEVVDWRKVSVSLASLLAGLTLFGIGVMSPLGNWLRSPQGTYVEQEIAGDRLLIGQDAANFITTLRAINQQVAPQEGILLAPHIPAMYSVLEQESPLWDLYFLFPETEEEQQEMIQTLGEKQVNWVVLGDIALDQREDLRFRNTHPILWQDFMENFTVIENNNLPPNYQLLRREP